MSKKHRGRINGDPVTHQLPSPAGDTGDENIGDTAILQFCNDRQPEFRALGLGGPNAQHFFHSVQIHANGQIHGT